MAAKNKPYEQFGPYILFKKLKSDALGELWRAARVDGAVLSEAVALRRLSGGNREALAAAAAVAHEIVPQLNGTSFARNQVIDVINGVPFIAHDYAGGRSLRHIVDRSRGGNGVTANPIPIDQAIVIAEKVALSIATTADMRQGGSRLSHGALIPQFVWITDDGEIRVAGQQLGKGIVTSLSDGKMAQQLGAYFAPEYRSSGEPSKTSEVYSMGALLYLLVTGIEPPDATSASAFTQAVGAAKTTAGTPMPEDIRGILEKSLALDPSARYGSMAEMKQALSGLANSGKYSATTFNLAFYVSNLLKRELEGESLERDRETKTNLAPYLEAPPQPLAAAAPRPALATPVFAGVEEKPKSRAPLAVAAVIVLALVGAGAWFMLGSKKSTTAASAPQLAAVTPIPPPRPAVISQPLVATPSTTTATPGSDEAAGKKAFEDAVQLKLQNEMMKLQTDYTKQLQQQQSKHAPVPSPQEQPAAASLRQQPEAAPPSAAQLDQQRMQNRQEAPAVQPQPTAAAVQPQPIAAPPLVQVAQVHEGDVVDLSDLDSPPHVTRGVMPSYPPMALRQRLEATILVSALVSETGDVLEVKVLRGDKRLGFEDSAVKAVRATKFSAPVKDGKRVKTWFPLPVIFKL
ncbi:MAG: Serine/threonine-protein kinase PknB [Acidobacteria bacterium]|nr:Serine/threonine-protein kinase PknB [Acidobacteriota bacterium]